MVLSISLLITCLFFSVFFSCSETAFTSLSLVQIQKLKSQKKKSARLLEEFYNKPSAFISTILIGNNIANVSISVISSAITIEVFGSVALGITTAVLTLTLLIFGEIIPKQLAILYNERICLRIARIIKFLSVVFFPLIVLTRFVSNIFIGKQVASVDRNAITQDSILHMVRHAQNTGEIADYESQIVKSLFRFSDITVHAVMTHRQKVFSLDQNLSCNEAIPHIINNKLEFSRIPIYENNSENITGIVFLKQIMLQRISQTPLQSLYDIKTPPIYIPETWKINKAFHKLKREKQNMAVVLDEYGGLAGIVTMEDLVEEIVGELYDEGETAFENFIQKSDQEDWYIVSAQAAIYEIEDYFALSIDNDHSDTIAGYVIQHISALPNKDQRIQTDIGTFVIQEMTKNRIESLLFKPKKLMPE